MRGGKSLVTKSVRGARSADVLPARSPSCCRRCPTLPCIPAPPAPDKRRTAAARLRAGLARAARTGSRERHGHRGAGADLAAHDDAPAAPAHQLAADPEADAEARQRSLPGRGAAKTEVEDVRELVCGDPKALVLHREGHRRRVPRGAHADPDGGPAAGVLGRVAQQVRDDLAHLLAIGPRDRARTWRVLDPDELPLLPTEPPHSEDLVKHLAERHRGRLHGRAGTVQPPAVDGAGEQSLQTLRAALEDLEVLALLGCELPGAAVEKQGQRRVHDGERATQLVPHVGLPLARGLALAQVRLSHAYTISQPRLAGERPVPLVVAGAGLGLRLATCE